MRVLVKSNYDTFSMSCKFVKTVINFAKM